MLPWVWNKLTPLYFYPLLSWLTHHLRTLLLGENFPWPEAFRDCISDQEDGMGKILPPCSPSPWYNLSNNWYFLTAEDKCVRECDIGEHCNGKATGEVMYISFDECCNENLAHSPNSPCRKCNKNFWEQYFLLQPSPDTGYYPVCKYLMSLNESFMLAGASHSLMWFPSAVNS